MPSINLNCDMGESFGAWTMGDDAAIMPYIHSANIACGFHAGDAHTMRQTVALALKCGVQIGAHPGLNDLMGFGRRPLPISPAQAYDLVVVQIGALAAVAKTQGAQLRHVKAHGALYNMAADNEALSQAIVQAVLDVDPSLHFFTLAGSLSYQVARTMGLFTLQEVFADRTYQNDGTLTPRTQAGAMITDEDQAIAQVLTMVKHGYVRTLSNKEIPIQADTLCIHGDQAQAAGFAARIHQVLKAENLLV